MKERREFLKSLAGITAGMMMPISNFAFASKPGKDRLGEVLPLRTLGKTGEKVTMLGLGGYHIGWTTEKDAQETIEAALEGGIRFFDSAESYGPHTSEIRYGKYLTPQYRDLIFLMTKTQAKDAKTAREHLEGSLERMKTDHIDLWQVHSLYTPEDVEERITNGILEVMQEAKASGKVKHIGFTGHQNPKAHLKMLERTAANDIFETCQMPINPVDAAHSSSFINQVLPELLERNYGVIAMKTLADGRFFGEKIMKGKVAWTSENPVVPRLMSIRDAMYFAWSLPVGVLVSGAENAALIREKIEMAKDFSKLKAKERENLVAKVAELAEEGKVEYYKKV
jgi:aryl-alcohol dehydrogenase-like predicted oxidoreductase